MDEKRASRWRSLAKKAAKITGRLTKSKRELGLRESDARVRNDSPEEEFAVNLDVDMKRVFELKTPEECYAYLTGKDDYGQPVETIPISQTSGTVWLDFSPMVIDTPFTGQDVSLAQFITNLAYALKEGTGSGNLVVNFPRFLKIGNFRLVRIIWMKSLGAWYPQFEEK